jgi:hypothetical protein
VEPWSILKFKIKIRLDPLKVLVDIVSDIRTVGKYKCTSTYRGQDKLPRWASTPQGGSTSDCGSDSRGECNGCRPR